MNSPRERVTARIAETFPSKELPAPVPMDELSHIRRDAIWVREMRSVARSVVDDGASTSGIRPSRICWSSRTSVSLLPETNSVGTWMVSSASGRSACRRPRNDCFQTSAGTARLSSTRRETNSSDMSSGDVLRTKCSTK